MPITTGVEDTIDAVERVDTGLLAVVLNAISHLLCE